MNTSYAQIHLYYLPLRTYTSRAGECHKEHQQHVFSEHKVDMHTKDVELHEQTHQSIKQHEIEDHKITRKENLDQHEMTRAVAMNVRESVIENANHNHQELTRMLNESDRERTKFEKKLLTKIATQQALDRAGGCIDIAVIWISCVSHVTPLISAVKNLKRAKEMVKDREHEVQQALGNVNPSDSFEYAMKSDNGSPRKDVQSEN